MKYRSVFDIIGPIMIGPSSSHTAEDIGHLALMSIEIDQNINDEIIAEITNLPNITKVTKIII